MPEPFDWFLMYDKLKPLINKHLKTKDSSILNIGCGTSPLPFEMLNDGYKRITSIDISEVAIEIMKQKTTNNDLECMF